MNRRTLFLIGILFELIAIFGLFLPYQYRLKTGTQMTLETIPVDPSSIFRGSYVTLDYVVGMDVPLYVDDIVTTDAYTNYGLTYVVLTQKGETAERVRLTQNKPTLQTGEACLIGNAEYRRVHFADIGQYFADEKLAKELENVRNDHRLLVDVSIDSNCRATIRGLRIGQQVPADQAERERNDRFESSPRFEPLPEPPAEKPVPAPAR